MTALADIIAPPTRLVATSCCSCGIEFGLPDNYIERRRKDGRSFYCPNGHLLSWSKTEADRLRDELAKEKHRAEQAQANAQFWQGQSTRANEREAAVTRRLRATKAVVTRTKKKIVAGRCPCCSFKVKDLAEHMKSEHPKYDPEKAAVALAEKETG